MNAEVIKPQWLSVVGRELAVAFVAEVKLKIAHSSMLLRAVAVFHFVEGDLEDALGKN